MKHGKAKWGFVVIGAVAALTLGAIGVAGAAGSTSSATPTPGASAQGGQGNGFRGDGGGRHGGPGMLEQGGPGDLAEALAALSGRDEATIMQQRTAGTSFAEIARDYGVAEADLLAKATAIETAELDAAVKAGQITEAQKTQYLAGLQERLKTALTATDQMPAGGPGGGHHGGMGGGGDLAEALAALSGKDQATIMQALASGKTYAELAKAYDVAEADLLAKATAIETAELDAAVKAGQITEAQKAEILSGLQAHLEQELTQTHTFGGHGRGDGDGDGPHGFGGQAPSGSPSTSPTTAPTTQTSLQVY